MEIRLDERQMRADRSTVDRLLRKQEASGSNPDRSTMYTVFESGAEEPQTLDQVMEQYDLGVLKDTKKRALEYLGSGVFIRARMEFEQMKRQGMALKNESTRLKYVQEADKYIAECIGKLDELEAAKKSRPRRKIYAEPDISNL